MQRSLQGNDLDTPTYYFAVAPHRPSLPSPPVHFGLPSFPFLPSFLSTYLSIQVLPQRRDPGPQRVKVEFQIRPPEHDLAEKCLRAVDGSIPGADVEQAGTWHDAAVDVHVWRDGDVLLG